MRKLLGFIKGVSGIVILGLGVTANATPITSPYALCVYKGETDFFSALTGIGATCWLTLAAKASCDVDGSGNHHFHVVAAGAVPGDDPACSAIATSGLPWGGAINPAGGVVGGQLDTAHNTPGLPSVGSWNGAGWSVSAFGVVNGIAGLAPVASPCPGGNQMPSAITVTSGGGMNFGGVARLDTLGAGLTLRSCVLQ